MTTTVLERASAGDELAFRELTEPFRRELEFHCYRMLGSVQDAEDVLQETMLAAWRALADFERRSSLRTWLYRIATNRCLNVLRDAGRRPHSVPPLTFEIPAPTSMSGPGWLEPYPDHRLTWLADSQPGPAARYESREAVELAFISALQRLPGRQRAVLVLRDVLGFHAAETAAMLETSVEGVKSTLKRARATIEQELGDRPQRIAPPPPASLEEQQLVEQFARAFLADDIDGMVALVTGNAWFRMPPAAHEYHGRKLIGAFLTAVSEGHSGQSSRLIATRANGEPAFGTYYIDPLSGLVQQSGLLVLSLAGAEVAELTWFLGPGYLERFDLPTAPFVDAPVSKAPKSLNAGPAGRHQEAHMPVLMMVEIPGADTSFAEGMRHAGVLDELQTAQGFRGHWSGATRSGYRAIELWDSREDCQKFAEGHFAPKLPPGAELPPMEFFELNFEVKPAP